MVGLFENRLRLCRYAAGMMEDDGGGVGDNGGRGLEMVDNDAVDGQTIGDYGWGLEG